MPALFRRVTVRVAPRCIFYIGGPERGRVLAEAGVGVKGLDAEQLSWLVEFLLVAQEIYDEELGPNGVGDGEA